MIRKLNKVFLMIVSIFIISLSLTSCTKNKDILSFIARPTIEGYQNVEVVVLINGSESKLRTYYQENNTHASEVKCSKVNVQKYNVNNNYDWVNKDNLNEYDYVYECDDFTILRDEDNPHNSMVRFNFKNNYYVTKATSKVIKPFNNKPMSNRSIYRCDYHVKQGDNRYEEYYQVRPFIQILDDNMLYIYNHIYQTGEKFQYFVQSNNTITLVDQTNYLTPNLMLFINDSKTVLTLVAGEHIERYTLYKGEYDLVLFNVEYIL